MSIVLKMKFVARERGQMVQDADDTFKAAKPVTSYQVAEAANVSQSTVSLVLSGRASGRVSAATQTLVLETARSLGYQRNELARVLRTGAPRMLALAVPNVKQPFFGQIFVAAELAAREAGFSVILIDASTDTSWTERLVGMLGSKLIAGCIVYASDDLSEPGMAEIRDKVLFVEANSRERSGVDLDVEEGVRAVVSHLAALGHKRIGYFAADYPKATYRRRFEIFVAEIERLGLTHDEKWKATSTFELEGATSVARKLLSTKQFTAIFCDDDLLAAAVYRAAKSNGIAIPARLSVVGFNDIELARILDPELTTVSIPADLVAQEAVRGLLNQITHGSEAKSATFVAPLTLKVRNSTAVFVD